MKYAQKMVLIPEVEYHTLLDKPKSKTGQLRQDMKDILKGKRDHTAAAKMSQLFGAYMRTKASEKPPAPKSKQDDFLEYFDPIYHKKVKLLVSQLRDHGIEWNEQKELRLSSGETIAHSNIIDLIKEAVVGTKKKQREPLPIGWQAFIEAIASSSIPVSLFKKKSTLDDIARAQHHAWEVY